MSLARCSCCQTTCVELHKHHVVPKSRGGTDEETNLVKLCLECHGKAHDVTFTSKVGVVSGGVKRTREAYKKAFQWASEDGLLEDFLEEIRCENHVLYDFLLSGMELGVIDVSFLFCILNPEFRSKRYSLINLGFLREKEIIRAYGRVKNDSIRH